MLEALILLIAFLIGGPIMLGIVALVGVIALLAWLGDY